VKAARLLMGVEASRATSVEKFATYFAAQWRSAGTG
jgi:hypothetical protein